MAARVANVRMALLQIEIANLSQVLAGFELHINVARFLLFLCHAYDQYGEMTKGILRVPSFYCSKC